MSALKVLFIGGSGIISSACSALAVERGLDLYVLNRGSLDPRRCPPEATVLRGRHPRPGVGGQALGDLDVRRGRRLGGVHARARPGRRRPLPRPDRAVRLHQLGLGLPDAAGAGARSRSRRRCATRSGSTPATRSPARTLLIGGLPGRGLPGDDRAAVAHLRPDARCRSTAAGPRSTGCARAAGRRARRRHVAVDADPPRRLRQGLRAAARATRARSARRSTSPPTTC